MRGFAVVEQRRVDAGVLGGGGAVVAVMSDDRHFPPAPLLSGLAVRTRGPAHRVDRVEEQRPLGFCLLSDVCGGDFEVRGVGRPVGHFERQGDVAAVVGGPVCELDWNDVGPAGVVAR